MVRGNISGHTDWKVDHIQTEKYIPTLDFYEAIGLAPFSVLVYLLSLYSIRNIFKFLNRKKGRAVNQMIFYQQVLLIQNRKMLVCSMFEMPILFSGPPSLLLPSSHNHNCGNPFCLSSGGPDRLCWMLRHWFHVNVLLLGDQLIIILHFSLSVHLHHPLWQVAQKGMDSAGIKK